MSKYKQGKARARELAIEYQNSISDGVQYSYGGMAIIQGELEKLAKRYGLLKEFRENAII